MSVGTVLLDIQCTTSSQARAETVQLGTSSKLLSLPARIPQQDTRNMLKERWLPFRSMLFQLGIQNTSNCLLRTGTFLQSMFDTTSSLTKIGSVPQDKMCTTQHLHLKISQTDTPSTLMRKQLLLHSRTFRPSNLHTMNCQATIGNVQVGNCRTSKIQCWVQTSLQSHSKKKNEGRASCALTPGIRRFNRF